MFLSMATSSNVNGSPQRVDASRVRRAPRPSGRRCPALWQQSGTSHASEGPQPGDVWAIPTRPYAGPHFAAFLIELPQRCIAAGCKPGGNVLDLFTGAGTTGLAAIQLGRRFTGIELSTAFAGLTAERLGAASRPGNGGGPL